MRNPYLPLKKIRIKFKPFNQEIEDCVRRFVIERLLSNERDRYHLIFQEADCRTRRDIRIKVEDQYTTLLPGKVGDASHSINARLEDLSCGGTCVLINDTIDLKIGSEVRLSLPCFEKSFLVEGTVLGVH